MKFNAKFDTVLMLTCRCCSHVTRFLVPEQDAILAEAAFNDGHETLIFQCVDAAGEERTTNLTREDYRSVQRAPLTKDEVAALKAKRLVS